MARRSRGSTIPLKHRLPNPSALFVGRQEEVAWLSRTLETAPVALIRGPGGVGKTSLVLYTLLKAFPDQVERTLFVSIAPGEPSDQVRLTLAHVLAAAADARDSVEIAGLRGDPEELTSLALDLAEEGPFWVVIDDLQHSDATEMGELISQLSAYARNSRWIITTRSTGPLPTLEGQTLDVERLSPATLAEIARAIDPARTPSDVQAAVGASAGSPWLLKQYLAAGAEGLALSRAGVLESLTAEGRQLLQVLSIVEAALDQETLAALVTLPDDAELDSLFARGLVIRTGAGWTVHDQVAEFLFPAGASQDGTDDALRMQLAEALAALPEPEPVLEALRLFNSRGRLDALVSLLDARGDELMALGFAPRVWALVGAATDRRVGLWQLRCAAELGNATVLAAVQPPKLTTDGDQLAWAATQYLLGEREEARRIALQVAGRTDEPKTVAEATLLSARCLMNLGRAEEASVELSKVTEPMGSSFALAAQKVLTDACLDREGTSARCASLLSTSNAQAGPEPYLDLATAFYRTGDRDRADEVIDRVLSTPRGGRARLLVARRALLLRARIRMDKGELGEAVRLLELVRPYARGVSILRPFVMELDAARRLVVGELDGLEVALARGVELARHADAGLTRRFIDLGDRLHRLLARARTDVDGDVPDGPSPWETPDEARIRKTLAEAHALLGSGDLMDAVDAAKAARREAERLGLSLLVADTLIVLAGALCAGLHVEEMSAVIDALNEHGERLGSARLLHHAAFYEGYGEPSVLERLATCMSVAPVVARRAQSLMGGHPPLDVVDERVLAAARADWDERRVEMVRGAEGSDWQPAWGLDTTRLSVWLPDGRTVPLQKKPTQWRILTTLAANGGSATKEQLINSAWGEAEYHPIRHDSKLHVSVRSLRKVLEDDPSTPTRLLTTEQGYALGGVVRQLVETTG